MPVDTGMIFEVSSEHHASFVPIFQPEMVKGLAGTVDKIRVQELIQSKQSF
jgi:hypothetical protein